MGVPQDAAERCVAELRHAGYPQAAVVGRVAGQPAVSSDGACVQLCAAA